MDNEKDLVHRYYEFKDWKESTVGRKNDVLAYMGEDELAAAQGVMEAVVKNDMCLYQVTAILDFCKELCGDWGKLV